MDCVHLTPLPSLLQPQFVGIHWVCCGGGGENGLVWVVLPSAFISQTEVIAINKKPKVLYSIRFGCNISGSFLYVFA